MGFFRNILDKLGIDHADDAHTTPPASTPPSTRPASAAARPAAEPAHGEVALSPSADTSPVVSPLHKPAKIVDVVALLETRADATTQKLNWRSSIVDLLKLLELDSSLAARQDLARELGCPPELMSDSAKMNMWLHKAVLQRVAENGGNVPPELLN